MKRLLTIAVLFITVGLSQAQTSAERVGFYAYCYVDGKVCTLEEVSKVFSKAKPEKCNCYYLHETGSESFQIDSFYKHRNILWLFIETRHLEGRLEIPLYWHVYLSYAPVTRMNVEIINSGVLVAPDHSFPFNSLIYSGKLITTETGSTELAVIPENMEVENRGITSLEVLGVLYYSPLRKQIVAYNEEATQFAKSLGIPVKEVTREELLSKNLRVTNKGIFYLSGKRLEASP